MKLGGKQENAEERSKRNKIKMHTRYKILSVEHVDENRIQIEKTTRTEGTNSTVNECTLYKIK